MGKWGKEKERQGKKRKEKKKKEKKKEKGNCSGFQNPNLYPFWIFWISTSFLRNLIVFSIFSKYDAKMNFQVTIFN